MTETEIEILIKKANRFLKSAEILFKSGDYDSTASRAHYAMFNMVEALLITKNISPKSHSGLISLFGEHFVKTGIFPNEVGR